MSIFGIQELGYGRINLRYKYDLVLLLWSSIRFDKKRTISSDYVRSTSFPFSYSFLVVHPKYMGNQSLCKKLEFRHKRAHDNYGVLGMHSCFHDGCCYVSK
jgi:hypothetical protein